MKTLIETTSPLYLRRLLKILKWKSDIYTDGRRLYSFEEFKIADGKLTYGPNREAIDPERLFDGNGQPIAASRTP